MAWLRMVFRLHQTSLSPFTSHLFRTNQSTMPTLRWVKRDLHAGAGGASAGDKRTREEENAAAVAVTSGAEVNAASTSTERIRVIDIVLPLVKSGNPDWSLLTVLGSFLLPNLVQYDQATGHLTVVEGKLEEFLPAMKAKLLKILPPHKAGAFKARTTAPGQYNRQMKEMGWVVSKSSDGSLVYRHQHGFGVGKDAATHWRRPKEVRLYVCLFVCAESCPAACVPTDVPTTDLTFPPHPFHLNFSTATLSPQRGEPRQAGGCG